MSAQLKTTRHDNALILTIANPGKRNALHPDMSSGAIEALATADRDASVRAVILTGADDFFCAGGDLHRLIGNRALPRSVQAGSIDHLNGWIEALRSCTKPVIAAVEGGAAGAGFSLALACDMIIAGTSAKFMMAYVNVGLTPDGGGSWFLSQALPRQLATEILMNGKAVSAERLYQTGLINRIVADGSALEAALQLASELGGRSPNAIKRIKELVGDASGNALTDQFAAEKHHFVESLHHADAQEGITAFLEKRAPRYR